MNGNNCSECHRAIRDQWIYKVGGSFHHASCLSCAVCNSQLDETCYSYNGAYYCKKDYFTYFGPRCGSCQINIQFDEYSTRLGDHYFHPNCLNCSVCHVTILKGQNVGFSNDGLLYCEDHSFMSFMKTTLPYGSFDSGIESDLSVNNDSGANTPSSLLNLDDNNSSKSPESEDDDDKVKDLDENGKENKRRGPRTTIKAKQFEVLKTVFSQTPKPTRLMREQLAKETGLPMRVIQVWFQNKRSKEKRMHQMRFMARGPFLPPNAASRRPGMRYPGYYPGGPVEMPPGGPYGGPEGPPYGGDFPPNNGGFYPGPNGFGGEGNPPPEGLFESPSSNFPSPPPGSESEYGNEVYPSDFPRGGEPSSAPTSSSSSSCPPGLPPPGGPPPPTLVS